MAPIQLHQIERTAQHNRMVVFGWLLAGLVFEFTAQRL
jgi:hypothetical protein